MKISKNMVVTISYVLKDPFGKVLEDSATLGTLDYLHGHENMLQGVEKRLDGQEIGFKKDIVVQPEDGYGSYDDGLIDTMPLDQFDFDTDPEVGQEVVIEVDGDEVAAVIENVSEDEITLNANHPLSGIVLHFSVEVLKIRIATGEEISASSPFTGEQH